MSTVPIPEAAVATRTARDRWASVWLLAVAVAVGGALRTTLAPVQEAARLDLRLDDYAMSLVQGFAAALPIALLAVPLGRVVDRGRRVRMLFWLCMASSAGAALTAVATSFPMLFAARMLAGVGGFCGIPAAISAASDMVSAQRRGRALLLLTGGQYVGVAAAFTLGGALAGAAPAGLVPWRFLHIVFAASCAALSLPLLLVGEPERREVGGAPHPELRRAAAELWRRRAVLGPLFLGQAGVVMADTAATLWAAPILQRDHHIAPAQFGVGLGALVLATGLGGAVGGGLLADAGRRRGGPAGVIWAAAAAAALALPGTLFGLAPGVAGFAAGLGLLLLCGSAAGLVTAAAITVVTPNEIRGVCLGAFVVLGALLGLGLAPTLVAWAGAALDGAARLGPAMAAVAAPIGLVSAAAFVWAAVNARRVAGSAGGLVAPD